MPQNSVLSVRGVCSSLEDGLVLAVHFVAFKYFLSSQPFIFPAQPKCSVLLCTTPFRCDVNSRLGSFLRSAPVVLSFFASIVSSKLKIYFNDIAWSLNLIFAVQHLFPSFLPNFCMLFINVIQSTRLHLCP